ncbi:MAG: phBC6A51 family helix-turn-helix protein [Planctomycetota bacterium]
MTKGKTRLTDRQIKAIPFLVTSATYTEGCKKAKINKTTLYKWLREPPFKKELDRQRELVAAEAFGLLSQALTKAVENLVDLIDSKDVRVRRLACKDLIEFFLQHKENEELAERMGAIERRLDAGTNLR